MAADTHGGNSVREARRVHAPDPREESPRSRPLWIWLCGLLLIATFLVDVLTPSQVVGAIGYSLAVFASVRLRSVRAAWIVVAIATSLSLSELLITPFGDIPMWMRLTNRVLVLCALWVMGYLGTRLIRELRWQQQIQETLEERVAERTAVADHRASQLRRLAKELTNSEQRERKRLAQMLHDHLQQLLFAAKIHAGTMRKRVNDDEVLRACDKVLDLLNQSIHTSRTLAVELSPPVLQEGGLAAALEWLAGWMHEKYGLTVKVSADPNANPEIEETRVFLFQATRELLFNVVKHSGVEHATVSMMRLPGARVGLEIVDRGAGFDPEILENGDQVHGFGLFSVRERLELLGGELEISSAPGRGARFWLLAPLHRPEEEFATTAQTAAGNTQVVGLPLYQK